jgi:hypothetical protein
MTDSLFEGADNALDPNKDYLAELVGDGKKFKTPQDLAKGKYEADNYVSLLTKKLDQLRDDYTKLDTDYKARAKLEELMDKHFNSQQQSSSETNLTANDRDKPGIDPKQIEELVDTRIKQTKQFEREQANLSKVKDKLVERFGSNYQTILNERIESLELSAEDVNALAKKSPTALFKALELEAPTQDSFQAPPRSQKRSDTFSPKGGPKRTWSYYQDLKKANPQLYNDPKITIQMEKDYLALGDSFEDGDFHSQ